MQPQRQEENLRLASGSFCYGKTYGYLMKQRLAQLSRPTNDLTVRNREKGPGFHDSDRSVALDTGALAPMTCSVVESAIR